MLGIGAAPAPGAVPAPPVRRPAPARRRAGTGPSREPLHVCRGGPAPSHRVGADRSVPADAGPARLWAASRLRPAPGLRPYPLCRPSV